MNARAALVAGLLLAASYLPANAQADPPGAPTTTVNRSVTQQEFLEARQRLRLKALEIKASQLGQEVPGELASIAGVILRSTFRAGREPQHDRAVAYVRPAATGKPDFFLYCTGEDAQAFATLPEQTVFSVQLPADPLIEYNAGTLKKLVRTTGCMSDLLYEVPK